MPSKIAISEMSNYAERREICEHILSRLPDWFGPHDVYKTYLDDLEKRPVFGGIIGHETVGIMALTRTSRASVDIHLLAVAPDEHGNGIGTALVQHAVDYARICGAKFLTVKTLGPSRDLEAYAKTRAFYERQGFLPLEEFADFWGKGNPMLLLCQALD